MSRHHGSPERDQRNDQRNEGQRTGSEWSDRGGRGETGASGMRDDGSQGNRSRDEYGERGGNTSSYQGDSQQRGDSRGWSSDTDMRNRGYGNSQQPMDGGFGQRNDSGSDWRGASDGGWSQNRNERPYGNEGSMGSGRQWGGQSGQQGFDSRNSASSGREGYGSRDFRGAGSSWGGSSGGEGRGWDASGRESSYGGQGRNPMGSGQSWNSSGSGNSATMQGPSQERGIHSGKAPKGYKRSDERIREDVCDRLTEHDIDCSEVDVKVSNGEVTLTGTVSERECKFKAERIAEAVSGVHDVQNQIKVKRDGERSSETSGAGSSTQSSSQSGGKPAGR